MKKATLLLFLGFILYFSSNSQSYSGKLGYGFSPLGFPADFSQIPAFFTEVANTCNGGVVMGNGSWRDSLNGSEALSNLHKFIAGSQPSPYGYTDMLVFGWASYPVLYLNAPGNPVNNWTNTNTKNLFLQTLKSAADSLKPAYLFVGNEVNFYWEQDSVDYLNWSAFYSQAYDTIKKYSPATKVGTVYNYEGLAGTGALVGWSTPYWGALTSMDTAKMDVIGLTVYPFLAHPTAASVPPTYLDAAFNRIGNKPVVLTETGWPADSTQSGAPWACSPVEQVTYVNKIFSILNGRNVEDVNWLFLNYLMSNDPSVQFFKSVALRDSLGNDRPALAQWLNMCNTTGVSSAGSENDFDIYPNPAQENITITFTQPGTQFVLRDVLGNVIYTGALNGKTTQLDVHQIKKGIYFLTVFSEQNNMITKKLILD